MAKLADLGTIKRIADELSGVGEALAYTLHCADNPDGPAFRVTVGGEVVYIDPRPMLTALQGHAEKLMDRLRALGVEVPPYAEWIEAERADYYA